MMKERDDELENKITNLEIRTTIEENETCHDYKSKEKLVSDLSEDCMTGDI
jgi:hypothetical protein